MMSPMYQYPPLKIHKQGSNSTIISNRRLESNQSRQAISRSSNTPMQSVDKPAIKPLSVSNSSNSIQTKPKLQIDSSHVDMFKFSPTNLPKPNSIENKSLPMKHMRSISPTSLFEKKERNVTINVFNASNNYSLQAPVTSHSHHEICPTCHQPWPSKVLNFSRTFPEPPTAPLIKNYANPSKNLFKVTRFSKEADKRLKTMNDDGLRPSEYKSRIDLGLGNLYK